MAARQNATQKAASRKKAAQYSAKAGVTTASDDSILAGTLAEGGLQRIANREQYWYLYSKHPWVRACVRIVANAVAQEGFVIARAEGEDAQPLTDADDSRVGSLHQFFRQAFGGKTFRQSIKAITIDLEVHGWAFWRKKRMGKDLLFLERLDPRLINPKLNDAGTEIAEFEMLRGTSATNGIIVQTQVSEKIPAADVIMFRLEGGDVVLGTPSPLEALDLTIALDLSVRKHRNATFQNHASVGLVLVNKDADEDAVRAAVKQINAEAIGTRNAYRPRVLTGDWDVHSINSSGKQEVDFVKATEISRDEVCAVYSIPPGKLISVSGSMGQAGKGEDDETFEQECVLPLEELIYETMTLEILNRELGITDLELVPRRRSAIRLDLVDKAVKMVQCGATGNESRDILRLPRVDDAKMDVPLFINHTAQTVDDDELQSVADGVNQTPADTVPDNEVAQKGAKRFQARSHVPGSARKGNRNPRFNAY